MTDVRPNWREIPFWLLRKEEIALMSTRQLVDVADWSKTTDRDRERIALVDTAISGATNVIPCCGNCHSWRNGGGPWGGCWSMDGLSEPLDAPVRSTLAIHRCEAWHNPNAIFLADGYAGIEAAKVRALSDGAAG